MPRASKALACRIFEQLLEPAEGQAGRGAPAPARSPRLSDLDPAAHTVPDHYAEDGTATLDGLLGGGP